MVGCFFFFSSFFAGTLFRNTSTRWYSGYRYFGLQYGWRGVYLPRRGVGWGGEDNNVSKGGLTKCRQLSAGVEKLRTGPLSRLKTTSSVRPSVRPHSTASWWNILAMCQSRSTETLALSIKLHQVIREFHTISVVWLKYLVLSVKLKQAAVGELRGEIRFVRLIQRKEWTGRRTVKQTLMTILS